MNKAYFLAPLAALALFIGAYAWSESGREQRAEARRIELKAAQEAKVVAERAAREKAIAEALALQEQRKKERLAREARETAEREARQAALDARDSAFREQERLARESDLLKREIADEQEAVNRLQLDKDAALAEQAHLQKLLPQARANVAALTDVLDKITAAEAARAKAAAQTKS